MNINSLFGDADNISRFQGEPGKRQELVLKVTAIIPLDMGYAVEIVKFSDLTGNEFVWFASKRSELEPGSTWNMKATVKRHSRFRGIEQTVINRPRFISPYVPPFVREQQPEDIEVSDQSVADAFLAI